MQNILNTAKICFSKNERNALLSLTIFFSKKTIYVVVKLFHYWICSHSWQLTSMIKRYHVINWCCIDAIINMYGIKIKWWWIMNHSNSLHKIVNYRKLTNTNSVVKQGSQLNKSAQGNRWECFNQIRP